MMADFVQIMICVGTEIRTVDMFVERRAFPSESASGPPWMIVDVLISVVGDIARIQVYVLDFVIL